MPNQWKVKDAEFHLQRAEAERRAAIKAGTSAAAASHRNLALEHEVAAFKGMMPQDIPAFDEAEFLRFVLRAAHAVPTSPGPQPASSPS